ncbi:hypothetical protein F5883DRAFT_555149 [Diaporthe sp. PMI_573]|nr:hypothetical protein F5883DRAFT_555149 [Diaporthaceae sp. PMI_573]
MQNGWWKAVLGGMFQNKSVRNDLSRHQTPPTQTSTPAKSSSSAPLSAASSFFKVTTAFPLKCFGILLGLSPPSILILLSPSSTLSSPSSAAASFMVRLRPATLPAPEALFFFFLSEASTEGDSGSAGAPVAVAALSPPLSLMAVSGVPGATTGFSMILALMPRNMRPAEGPLPRVARVAKSLLLSLPVSSTHLHARTMISTSRVERPNGLGLGTALAFLADGMMKKMNDDENGESALL